MRGVKTEPNTTLRTVKNKNLRENLVNRGSHQVKYDIKWQSKRPPWVELEHGITKCLTMKNHSYILISP